MIIELTEEKQVFRWIKLKTIGEYESDSEFIDKLLDLEDAQQKAKVKKVIDFEEDNDLYDEAELDDDDTLSKALTEGVEVKVIQQEQEEWDAAANQEEAVVNNGNMQAIETEVTDGEMTYRIVVFSGLVCKDCSQSFQSEDELKAHEEGAVCKAGTSNNSPKSKIRPTVPSEVRSKPTGAAASPLKKIPELLKEKLVHNPVPEDEDDEESCEPLIYEEVMMDGDDLPADLSGFTSFKCGSCGREFQTLDALKCHECATPSANRLTCNICGKTFYSKYKLNRHFITHTNTCRYQCPICQKGIKWEERGLIRHIEEIHKDCTYVCGECGAPYAKTHSYRKHLADDHGILKYEEYVADLKSRRPWDEVFYEYANGMYKKNIPGLHCDFIIKENVATFACENCDVQTFTFKELKAHMAVDHPEVDMTIQQSFDAVDKSDMSCSEFAIHANFEGRFNCEFCESHFSSMKSLREHKVVHVDPYVCENCGKRFPKKHKLKSHELVHSVRDNKCLVCNREFTVERYLLRHIEDTHTSTSYRCEACDMPFSHFPMYRKHVQEHAIEIPEDMMLDKNEAGIITLTKTIATSDKLEVMLQDGKLNFLCKACDSVYEDLADYREHTFMCQNKKRHKNISVPYEIVSVENSKPVYRCTVCHKEFALRDTCRRHIKRTHETEPKVCQECGFQTCFPDTFKVHVEKEHLGITYACLICHETFSEQRFLKAHKDRMHADDVIGGVCDHCGKNFNTRAALAFHRKTHEEKKLECSICSKKFIRKQLLRDHMWTHAQAKVHCCLVCGKSFKTPSNLRMHEQVHHRPAEKLKCDVCKKTFKKLSLFTRHCRVKHGGEGLGEKADDVIVVVPGVGAEEGGEAATMDSDGVPVDENSYIVFVQNEDGEEMVVTQEILDQAQIIVNEG